MKQVLNTLVTAALLAAAVSTASADLKWRGDVASQEGGKLRVSVEFPRVASISTKVEGKAARSLSFSGPHIQSTRSNKA